MRVMVNGDPRETDAKTLSEILIELSLDGAVVATAVNGQFVAKAARQMTPLQGGDVIEVVAPMQGG